MKYSRVYLDSIGYELAPVVVSSSELESRLRPVFDALHVPEGQLAALTGIQERRWWEPGYPLSRGAALAARKALRASGVRPQDIDVLIYAGVCRENFEPATACRVAASVGVSEQAAVFDVSNACLGVLNGILSIANQIELGQVRAGLVVSCETAREINDIMIQRMLVDRRMDLFKTALATLTGGSGAVAVLVTDGSFAGATRSRLIGGVTQTAPEYHGLCRWGIDPGHDGVCAQSMSTDSISVLKYGVELGVKTWRAFLAEMGWTPSSVDKVICHQVGSSHQEAILSALELPRVKDFCSYEYLGNIGTVSLPLTAALAAEREFLQRGDRVGFLGIGSGLNCLMLGLEW
ncbi:MAG: 3-oxoacyl-ACP synthase III [Planctomycetes bacterium]|nr:3-oxoacyl-ACP synthase III [Planctomycetota bacterium]